MTKPVDLTGATWEATLYGAGKNGSAMQIRKCTQYPRLRSVWAREHRDDKGTTTLLVDGEPVADLKEAALRLAEDPPEGESDDK